MPDTRRNYVDGEWQPCDSGATFENRNPAATDEAVSVHQRSDETDANAAVEAADGAADDWATTPGPERGAILRAAAARLEDRTDELAATLTREEGKTLPEARPEVQRAVDIFYYYAEKARDFGGTIRQSSSRRRTLSTREEPVGVAGLITPWNYPIAIPAWKIAPALATGNAVVFKPAMQAPLVATKLVECLDDAGIPPGVLNMVTGPGSAVGEAFTTHDAVDAISFTGSAEVGEHVQQAATAAGKRVQLEMGGKNPAVVTSSAEIDEAVEIVGAGAFGVTGQACTATSRAIVHEDVHDEFLAGIVDYADSLTVGPGDDGYDMGPHVSESELEGTLDYVDVGKAERATLETGGTTVERDDCEGGHFVRPAVFSDVTPEMRIAREEIFGPVLSVIEVSDFEEALAVANDSNYGLSASILTRDHTEANRFVAESETGVVKINEKTTGLELHVPFGGVKDSSSETFREQGEAGMAFYTLSKTVYDNF